MDLKRFFLSKDPLGWQSGISKKILATHWLLRGDGPFVFEIFTGQTGSEPRAEIDDANQQHVARGARYMFAPNKR
jgi:hypothetical protein